MKWFNFNIQITLYIEVDILMLICYCFYNQNETSEWTFLQRNKILSRLVHDQSNRVRRNRRHPFLKLDN